MEMELQDILDRVTAMEASYELILKQQDEILSRLVTLEKRQHTSTPCLAPFSGFENTTEMESFSFDQSPLYIPPPPSHPPQRLSQYHHDSTQPYTPSRENQPQCHTAFHAPPPHPPQCLSTQSHTPSRENRTSPSHPLRFILSDHLEAAQDQTSSRENQDQQCASFHPPSHPPQRFIHTDHLESPHQECTGPTRVPFQPITTNQAPVVRRVKGPSSSLPSPTINKHKLIPASEVILNYPKLRSPSRVGTLATKLARESFFGEEVLAKCTVAGDRDLPALPAAELHQLKQTLLMQFPDYWRSPHEFEPLWKTSTESVGQLCKRLRFAKKK